MELQKLFPAMSKSQKSFCVNVFLSSYEAILDAPEEEMMQFIISNTDDEKLKSFPKVKEKVDKYKNTMV
jgi:hypothetical protein